MAGRMYPFRFLKMIVKYLFRGRSDERAPLTAECKAPLKVLIESAVPKEAQVASCVVA